MKKRNLSRPMLLLLILALVLIVVGIVLGVQSFSQFELIALAHESHEQLLYSVWVTAVNTMIFAGIVLVGFGILLVVFLRMFRRTARLQKEAEALHRKKEAMTALNEKTQQLAHHQRLEIIGTLTSSIAHEFNNLLTPIMGYSMMALEKLPPEEEELYDDILEIYNTSRKAKSIISRLSDLARKNNSTTFRETHPDDLIRKTLVVATPAKPPKVEVKLDLNCWDQVMQANEIQLSQLMLNLILNGFHAIGEQEGVLTIRTSYDENNILFQVSDTGCGIPDEIRNLIFEPFFTTKEAGKGTGLGLAIAAQVVEDHHGTIRVDTKVGQGTAFTVSLPRWVKSE